MGEARADQPRVEFRMLGPLEAVAAGHQLDLGSPKQRDLLAVLLINAGRVVSTAQLADELWSGSPPDRPEPTLQAYVSRSRKVLGAERLVTRAPGYMLDVRPDDIDAMRFERLLASGRDARAAHDPERARALLREALALWRGRALDGVRLVAAETEAARLEALRLECVEERIDCDLELGAGAELVAELQTLAGADPLRERVAGQLAVALYRAGRQSDALDVLQNVANDLREQLGVDPSPALRALEESILRQEPVLDQRPTVYVTADVQESRSFVGRGDELAAIDAALSEPGLLTLTGLGGTGKTRLAIAVAESRDDLEGIARLAPLRDGELVFRAIATSLGIDEAPGRRIEDQVTDHLASSAGLLVIDNCEHVLADVASVVVALRASCPSLRILATSREPIGSARERVWPVPPMQPQDATKLFAERATLANPDVLLPFDAVERACARVGGIPLAVELAAARTRVLTVEQIAERLGDIVRTIDPDERLASALTWAVDELLPAEQRVLEGLAVFAGSFTLDDAEAVVPDDDIEREAVLPSTARLVEMSLLTAEPDGDLMRYRMLEPVRQFAFRRHRDPAAIARSHLAWAMTTAGTNDDDLIVLVVDDIRAALTWAVTDANDPAAGIELACAMSGYWRIHGHWEEGMRWLGAAILTAADDDALIRVAHRHYAELAWAAGRRDEAVAHGRTAVALCEAAGDDHHLAWAMQSLAVSLHLDDPEASFELYERALDAARRSSDEMLEMHILHNLATVASHGGDNRSARVRFEEALTIAERRGDPEAIVIITQCLARLAIDRQDLDEARRLVDESLVLARRARIAKGITHGLYCQGVIAYISGDYVRAHAYYEEHLEAERQGGDPFGELQAMLMVSDVLQMREMHDDALRMAHAARDLAATLDRPSTMASVNVVLGELYMETGDLARAAVCLSDAIVTPDLGGRRWWSDGRTVARLLAVGGADEELVTLTAAIDAWLVSDDRPGILSYDPRLEDPLDRARERLGARFDDLWARGAAMSVDEAIAFAVDAMERTFSR